MKDKVEEINKLKEIFANKLREIADEFESPNKIIEKDPSLTSITTSTSCSSLASVADTITTTNNINEIYKFGPIITLNVGGKLFTSTYDTLTQHGGSKIASMVAGREVVMKDTEGNVFIDRDGSLFKFVLEYLRDGSTWKMPEDDQYLLARLIREFKFFGLSPTLPNLFKGTTLLSFDQQQQIQEWLGFQSKWRLVYKGITDGFSAIDFHARCDKKGETITVICSKTGFLFGGYTPLSWNCGNYSFDAETFIFTLTNPANLPAKYRNNGSSHANKFSIMGSPSFGPTFGGGPDIRVSDKCNTTPSFSHFPHSFGDITGRGNETFTGTRTFLVHDIEVFVKTH